MWTVLQEGDAIINIKIFKGKSILWQDIDLYCFLKIEWIYNFIS